MTKLPEFNARVLAQLSEEKIQTILPKRFMLVFDDGAFETTARKTIFSWYAWWPIRHKPEMPMLSSYHMGNNNLTGKTIDAITELTAWGMYDAFPGEIDPEYLALRIKQENNHFYNSMTYGLEEYVTSISAIDFIDVIYHPKILEITGHLQSLDLTNKGQLANMEREIEDAYNRAEEIIMNDPLLKGNRLVEAVKSKIVDILQVLQCVVARGKPTDVDSNVFPKPIVRGFGQGLSEFHDVFIESSSAKKALGMAKTPLAKVEYFNRQQQLSAQTLSTLDGMSNFYQIHGINCNSLNGQHDCGSKEYVLWKVDKKNLRDLDGLYHWNDAGVMELIKPHSTHLIGKLVKLRTALTCKHTDQYSICRSCFGQLSENIPYGTNIAHVSSVELCAKVSQKVLSTKHLDSTAVLDSLMITAVDRRYIKSMPNQYEITVSSKLDLSKAKIHVTKESIWGLGDIHKVENLEDLVPSRCTTMSDVTFEVENVFGGTDFITIPVSLGSRMSSFTLPFLGYIKQHGFEQLDDGSIVISLAHLPYDTPIWTLPRKHANMLEFMGSVEKLIKASENNKSKGKMDLTDHSNLANALADFYDLVSQKFSFSITHLAVMLRVTMVRSKKDYDYRLPIASDKMEFAAFNDIMKLRSLSGFAAFEKQYEMYSSPLSYLLKERPRHPFDEILIPTVGAY